jgi:oxygen-dependent protoporphyrinogen oxidase
MDDRPTLVVGGGIGGLTAAFRLSAAGVPVTLVESSPRFGGVIETDVADGWITELGPSTVMGGAPAFEALIRDAGLADELVTADRVGARRFIVRGGRAIALPKAPPGILSTPLLSPGARARLLAEPFIPRHAGGGDETVAAFVRRRLGAEALDWLAAPFVSGIYAGDPERMSVRHALPRLAAMEAEHGSLLKGAMAAGRAARRAGGGARRGDRLVSFREGLATLPRRLADRLAPHTLRGTIRGLTRSGAAWRAEALLPDGTVRSLDAARVILAVDAATAGRLLDVPEFAAVPAAGVRVAGFGFRRADVRHPLDGFGLLVPRREGRRLLGALFTSSLFPDRAPAGHVGITTMAGGATDPEVLRLPADEFVALMLADLADLLGTAAPPVRVVTRSWPGAIPQYELGHDRFLGLAERLEAERPGLHLLGSWRGGVSVPDRVTAATALADALTR